MSAALAHYLLMKVARLSGVMPGRCKNWLRNRVTLAIKRILLRKGAHSLIERYAINAAHFLYSERGQRTLKLLRKNLDMLNYQPQINYKKARPLK